MLSPGADVNSHHHDVDVFVDDHPANNMNAQDIHPLQSVVLFQ